MTIKQTGGIFGRSPTFADVEITGDIKLGDNSKAIFGAGSDLQIYHNGFASYITDAGTGDLVIGADTFTYIANSAGTKTSATFNASGAATLRYDNAPKLATTATGVDVTGTVTADGLTVDAGSTSTIATFDTTANNSSTVYGDAASSVIISNDHASGTARLKFRGTASESGAITFGGGIGSASDTFSVYPRAMSGGKSFTVSGGGDISFYEDTGATPKMVWSASAESLGLNKTSSLGTAKLEIRGAGNTNATNSIFVEDSGAAGVFAVRDNGEVFIKDSLGIGTSSPSTKLHVASSAGDTIILADNGTSQARFAVDNDGPYIYALTSGDNALRVYGENTERMRIDASGNLLVGTTAVPATSNTNGFRVDESGYISLTGAGTAAIDANRSSSDGIIANFRKDGATVGSIGADGGDVYIGTGDTGIIFSDGNDAIVPFSTTAENFRGSAIDLGYSTYPFKDLILSGGVYLGGTGAANKLDDYETGTWTPVITGATVTGAGTYTSQHGTYVKVGKVVTLNFDYTVTAHTGSGAMRIAGLPFASATTSGRESTGSCMTDNFNFSNSPVSVNTFMGTGVSVLRLYISQDDAGWVQQDIDTAHSLIGSITYITD